MELSALDREMVAMGIAEAPRPLGSSATVACGSLVDLAATLEAAAAATETPRLGNNLLGASVNQPAGTGNVRGVTLVIEASE
jgi:hypothetical protein